MNGLPATLVRFGSQLEDAIRAHPDLHDDLAPHAHEVDQTPRRRRTSRRRALLAAAAAVVAVVVGAGALLGAGSSASAIDRARAAIVGSGQDVLHVVAVTTLTGPNGATETSRTELWQHNAPPYDQREQSFGPDGTPGRELAVAAGRVQYYDPLTNTIQTTPEDVVVPSPPELNDEITGRGLVDRMRAFLASGNAHEEGRVLIDGRDAIRIVTQDLVLVVDASTYEPIEWRAGVSGTGGRFDTSTTSIHIYEWLPATPTNIALTSLDAQHPGAQVVAAATISGTDPPKGA